MMMKRARNLQQIRGGDSLFFLSFAINNKNNLFLFKEVEKIKGKIHPLEWARQGRSLARSPVRSFGWNCAHRQKSQLGTD